MSETYQPARVSEEQFYDPRWRLSNLYMVLDEKGNKIPFRPNEVQLDFLDNIHNLNIILKSRQLGFTTLCCLIYLDACIFNPDTRAGVIAHKLDDAKVIFRDKVQFPYNNLDEGLKANVVAIQDSADSLLFKNNSNIRVSTSMRSGTLQYLHISEFGKLCALVPERAREIMTGSLNTIHVGQFVVIESTAEGQDGYFYKMVQTARQLRLENLTQMDFKFHFYPWWRDHKNQLLQDVLITEADEKYFDKLLADNVHLTEPQKHWYIKKEMTQEGDMKREHPSTADEAFEQALEGAYFGLQIAMAYKHGRIGGYPFDPRYTVNTFWDLGRNDNNTIWMHQYIKGRHRFIGYYENSGEHISHYVKWLREWAEDRDAVFGEHYLPHDGDVESLWLEHGTKGVLDKLKFRPKFVERVGDKLDAINSTRSQFVKCEFDEIGTSLGLKRLKAYRKEWDPVRGVWKDRPRHDEASHGSDGFMTWAMSKFPEQETYAHNRREGARRYQGKKDDPSEPSSYMGV